MDMTKLTTIVTLLIGLSIASERLVEIVKGLIVWLDQPQANPVVEGRRKSILQILAVVSGIVTTVLAGPMIPTDVYNATTPLGILTLGLLASGGSGFWNSILTYTWSAKEVKKAEAEVRKQDGTLLAGGHRDLDLRGEQVTSNECYGVEGE